LGDLPGPAVVSSVEDRDAAVAGDRQAGLDLFEVGAAVLGMPELRCGVVGVDLVVGPIQRDRGHVPVKPGGVQPEHRDHLRTNRSHDVIEFGSDRVQCPPDPIIVEQSWVDAKDFLDRMLACPVGHPDQRCGGGQPVRDECFDHLSVAEIRKIAYWVGPVDDPGEVQTASVVGYHRQRAQLFLDARRDIPGLPPSTLLHV
jgi:hypothetical protein